MTERLSNLIQIEDIHWASQLMGLGPTGFDPVENDDSRLQAMLNLETADFEACPGSGKTTLLVAKLAILAMRWPYRTRGICVLSHTNAARHEIEQKLSRSATGMALLRYPHFIGTIHAFVNEYLAIPWLRSKGNPIRLIDTQTALRKRMASLDWNTRTALQRRYLDEYALLYDAPDYSGGKKGNLGRHTDLYQRLRDTSQISSKEGYFCFSEMFVWATELLDTHPDTVHDIRARFPLVFIDEAQDNSEEQSALLHRIFCAGGIASRRQRFGDSNQAIYLHANQSGATTDPFPSGAIYNLPRSYRFPQQLANEVKGFGVTPQALVGAGPSATGIKTEPKSPALFLFTDDSVQNVLPRYGDYLIGCFNEQELTNGTYVAVAGVHEMHEDTQIPRAMGHYVPAYDSACVKKDAAPKYFIQYLTRARYVMADTGNTHGLVNALASAIFALSEITGNHYSGIGHKSAHKRLMELLDDSSEYQHYLILVDWLISSQANFDATSWQSHAMPLICQIAQQMNQGGALSESATAFLEWPPISAHQEEVYASHRIDNLFPYPSEQPKVNIRLGSIHSVKGETHTATLVLDSFYYKHHLSELKPWLLGTRVGGSTTKKGKVVIEGSRMLGRLKLHYVAMTRPTHLLCIAMRKDAFIDNELEILQARGWQIVDCRRPEQGTVEGRQ